MPLNVTVPFQHRAHRGTWLLVRGDGMALLPIVDVSDGFWEGVRPVAPADVRAGLSSTEVNRLVDVCRLCSGLVNVVASPFPTGAVVA